MPDFYKMGRNIGSGHGDRNADRSYPQTECDRVSFERGLQRAIDDREIDREIDQRILDDRASFGY